MNYLLEEKEKFLEDKRKYFAEKDFEEVRLLIEKLDADMFEIVLKAKLKNPVILILVSILLGYSGVDRFMLGDAKSGIIKLFTGGGLYIWWILDIFTTSKRAKVWNINMLRGLIGGMNIPATAKEKFENIKNNKELQKVLVNGVKNISSSARELGNTRWI